MSERRLTLDEMSADRCTDCQHPRAVHPSANQVVKPHWPKCSYPNCPCEGWRAQRKEPAA